MREEKHPVFQKCLTNYLLAAAIRATFGRDSCYLRPRFALPSAASSATFGRKQQIFSGNEMTLQT